MRHERNGFDLIEQERFSTKIGDSRSGPPPEAILRTPYFCAISTRAGGGFFKWGPV